MAAVVGGVVAACRENGCALLGGETAEMPGVYQAGALDLAGTIVGMVEHGAILDGSRIMPGDAVIALPSSGLHTNGYSLARRVLAALDWTAPHPDLGVPVGDALLAVHRSYRAPVEQLRAAGIDLRGLAHITGGGVFDNLPRILPAGVGATIRRGAWPEPAIFGLIGRLGDVNAREMFQAFNMGLGMLAVIPREAVEPALAALPGDAYHVGEIVPGDRSVTVEGAA
jgi:phosphoribosylformylglycinamidine cyclo-ligase